jgi:hypothetical protein
MSSIALEISNCLMCGRPFEAETMFMPMLGRKLSVTVCDACAAREAKARGRGGEIERALSPEERRLRGWAALVPPRYADFHRDRLPAVIAPHIDRVLAWRPPLPSDPQRSHRGIGLLGPSRTGKSPLLFGLARQLHLEGHEVFATSGIDFQRRVHRSVVERAEWTRYLDRCENAAILLIDDADKLNFTPGVEAEYYGMLETRRNWERPLLCTLNLTGQQLTELTQDREDHRSDRMPAIVERLRDLCEFVAVGE